MSTQLDKRPERNLIQRLAERVLYGGARKSSWDFSVAANYADYYPLTGFQHNYADVDWSGEAGDPQFNSIVMAACNWITTNFATAPTIVRTLNDAGAQTVVANHPLTELLRRPNPDYTGNLLWDPTLLSYNVAGNAYWLKERNGNKRVIALRYLPHQKVRCVSAPGVYISGYERWYDGKWNPVAREDIIHFRNGLNPSDTRYGLSPLAPALLELAMDNEAARYGYFILRNMGVPGAILTPEGEFTIDAAGAEILKATYQARFTGSQRGNVMVTPGPVKLITPAFSPADVEADQMRTKPEERIAALLGIPPGVIGLGAGLARSTYNNQSEAYAAAYRNNLIPTQITMAATLDLQLLPEFSNKTAEMVWFDTTKIQELQDSQDSRVDRATKIYGAGIAWLNEARAVIDLPPVKDGDTFKAPPPAPAAPAAAPPAAPGAQGMSPAGADIPQPAAEPPKPAPPPAAPKQVTESSPLLKAMEQTARAALELRFEREVQEILQRTYQQALDEASSGPETRRGHPFNRKHNRPGDHPEGGYAPAWHSAAEMMAGPIVTKVLAEGVAKLRGAPATAQGDPFTYALAEEQGFTRPAQVVSKAELDGYVAAGEVELFRGLHTAGRIEAMRTGDYFAGSGAYGSGNYTAMNTELGGGRNTAKAYAGRTGAIGRMTLKAEAKVIGLEQLQRERGAALDALKQQLLVDSARAGGTLSRAATKAISRQIELIEDSGAYAMIHGYDAVHVESTDYMIVLNRTALRIQKERG